MTPKVSIVMPVLNGSKYIDHAIEKHSCRRRFRISSCWSSDDGSTDDTPERIAQFARRANVRRIPHEQPMGIARSVNDGLREAAGQYIGFLDHDDAWLPHFLETQSRYLDAHPEVGMVHSDFQTIDGEGRVLEHSVAEARRRGLRPSGHVFPQLFMDSFVVGNSVLIRRECFEKLSGFDESLRWADYNMWMRIARFYRVDYVPEVLTQYRQHAGQQTRGVGTPPPESVGMQSIKRILQVYPEARQEVGERDVRRRLAALYFDMAYANLQAGETATARRHLKSAFGQWPWDLRFFKLVRGGIVATRARGTAGLTARPYFRNTPRDSELAELGVRLLRAVARSPRRSRPGFDPSCTSFSTVAAVALHPVRLHDVIRAQDRWRAAVLPR